MAIAANTKTRKTIDRGAYIENDAVVSVLTLKDKSVRKFTWREIRAHIYSKHPDFKGSAQKMLLWFLADMYAEQYILPELNKALDSKPK